MQYLTALEDLKNFGAAARELNVTQPTLSQQIKTLEHRLGVTLIERGHTPVQLTPIGREISMQARTVLLQVGNMTALAARSGEGVSGTIRLGVTPTLGPYLLPEIVAALHREYPDLRLYIREGIPDEQLSELRRGALDILLTPLPAMSGSLHGEVLFEERLHLVAQPDHALLERGSIGRADLAGAQILSLDRRHHFHRQVETICNELGADLLRDYEGTSLDSLRQMAGSGLGLAILPELYIRSEIAAKQVVRKLHIDDWNPQRTITALWRKDAAYSQSYMIIAGAIRSGAKELLGKPGV